MRGLSFFDAAFEVELGLGVVCDAHHDDAPQRAVGLTVATVVGLDPAVGLARAVRDRSHAAQVGPGCFRAEPLGVVARSHHEGRRGVGTDAEEAEEIWHGDHEKRFDSLVELGQLAVERLDAMRQRRQ